MFHGPFKLRSNSECSSCSSLPWQCINKLKKNGTLRWIDFAVSSRDKRQTLKLCCCTFHRLLYSCREQLWAASSVRDLSIHQGYSVRILLLKSTTSHTQTHTAKHKEDTFRFDTVRCGGSALTHVNVSQFLVNTVVQNRPIAFRCPLGSAVHESMRRVKFSR